MNFIPNRAVYIRKDLRRKYSSEMHFRTMSQKILLRKIFFFRFEKNKIKINVMNSTFVVFEA